MTPPIPHSAIWVEWNRAMADMEQAKAGDPAGYERCAERFLALYEEHAHLPASPHALYNAAECYKAAGDRKGLLLFRRLVREHPESELANKARQILAETD